MVLFCARVRVIITEAVCLVGNKGLAGGGYLLLGAQDGFDDEVLHLSHQHWKTMETLVACQITHRAATLTPTILSALGGNFNVDDTQWSSFLPIAQRLEAKGRWKW